MRTIGIVAEYNPFHSGHGSHLAALRQTFGSGCAIVCAMSGNWVQRGQPALADKWTRAALALSHGVDLVLELPTLWAAASAEAFARGGVGVLAAAGVVDTLSFGSEAGALSPLRQVADCLHTPAWQAALHDGLDRGLSFPAARQQAARALVGEAADCLSLPNNNLGVEYLLALEALGSTIVPHTLPRQGAGHDQAPQAGHASASWLRQQILAEDPTPLAPYLSPPEEEILRADPASLTACTLGVLARLRTLSEADFARLPDCGEGLSHRLFRAAQSAVSLPDLYAQVQSKRYPLARVRRLVLWAFLGLRADDRLAGLPYLRVLGFSPRGQELLRQMKTAAALPVLVKPAHAARLADPAARRVFELEARCTALYDLCRKNFGRTPGPTEYARSPVRWDPGPTAKGHRP